MNLDTSIVGSTDKLAALFAALSDPTRLRIVRALLDEGQVCVCKLVEHLDVGQSTVSHHMAVLKHAGLVRSKQRGQWVDYTLTSPAVAAKAVELLQTLRAHRRAPQPRAAQAQGSVRCSGPVDSSD